MQHTQYMYVSLPLYVYDIQLSPLSERQDLTLLQGIWSFMMGKMKL